MGNDVIRADYARIEGEVRRRVAMLNHNAAAEVDGEAGSEAVSWREELDMLLLRTRLGQEARRLSRLLSAWVDPAECMEADGGWVFRFRFAAEWMESELGSALEEYLTVRLLMYKFESAEPHEPPATGLYALYAAEEERALAGVRNLMLRGEYAAE